jgi:DNA invertase Pin-like site-specific DNA recombinase
LVRAIIYTRLSRNRTGEQSESTLDQERACRKLAADRGAEVVSVETDDDRSAYTGKRRAGYERVLDAIRLGSVDLVLARHPDRLHRSPIELEEFIDVVDQSGVEVATVQAGRVDLSTPTGRMQARMTGTVARYESEHRSERTKDAHERIASQGRWAGGTIPFGYHHEKSAPGGLSLDPEQSDRVRGWVDSLLAGDLLADIVKALNEEGYPPPRGSRWTIPSVRGIVTSDRIAGLRVHKGEVFPAKWPAIVTPEELEAVRRLLRARGGRRTPESWRRYLLSGGLAVCGRCGAALHARRRGNGTPVYHCEKSRGGCGSLSVVAERLEESVTEMAFGACERLALVDTTAPSDGAEVSEVQGKLAALASMWAAGDIEIEEWDAAKAVLLARRDEAARRSAPDPLAAYRGSENALEAAWPTLSVQSRRVLLEALMEHVEVHPAKQRGRTWDPSRVHPLWR